MNIVKSVFLICTGWPSQTSNLTRVNPDKMKLIRKIYRFWSPQLIIVKFLQHLYSHLEIFMCIWIKKFLSPWIRRQNNSQSSNQKEKHHWLCRMRILTINLKIQVARRVEKIYFSQRGHRTPHPTSKTRAPKSNSSK